jgi:hypothetical protein
MLLEIAVFWAVHRRARNRSLSVSRALARTSVIQFIVGALAPAARAAPPR